MAENSKVEKSENLSTDHQLGHDKDMETVWLETHPECPVCLQPCLQPVQTPCLHVFCFLCLKGFVYRSKRCALCRSEVPFEYFQNPVVVKIKNGEASLTSSTSIEITEKYNWFYEGRNGWWEYDERAQVTLEEAFKTEARSCELLISGFSYFVDFGDMVQFRKSHPTRRRRIKRDRIGVDRKGVAGLKVSSCTTSSESQNLDSSKSDTDLTSSEKIKEKSQSDLALDTDDSEQELVSQASGSVDIPKPVSSTTFDENELAEQLDKTL
ncbi:E3 ubiquitin-protein ligase rnf146-like [Clytia hemisphaerica]|uniref:E3 ubiquitin-protein ligase n=1 Tax=Clytia hemisphaerica TaxID=252671 RepID=A0A7M5UYK8_9CNID